MHLLCKTKQKLKRACIERSQQLDTLDSQHPRPSWGHYFHRVLKKTQKSISPSLISHTHTINPPHQMRSSMQWPNWRRINNNNNNTNNNYYDSREFGWESVEFPSSREHIIKWWPWIRRVGTRRTVAIHLQPRGLSWRGLRQLPRSNLVWLHERIKPCEWRNSDPRVLSNDTTTVPLDCLERERGGKKNKKKTFYV